MASSTSRRPMPRPVHPARGGAGDREGVAERQEAESTSLPPRAATIVLVVGSRSSADPGGAPGCGVGHRKVSIERRTTPGRGQEPAGASAASDRRISTSGVVVIGDRIPRPHTRGRRGTALVRLDGGGRVHLEARWRRGRAPGRAISHRSAHSHIGWRRRFPPRSDAAATPRMAGSSQSMCASLGIRPNAIMLPRYSSLPKCRLPSDANGICSAGHVEPQVRHDLAAADAQVPLVGQLEHDVSSLDDRVGDRLVVEIRKASIMLPRTGRVVIEQHGHLLAHPGQERTHHAGNQADPCPRPRRATIFVLIQARSPPRAWRPRG